MTKVLHLLLMEEWHQNLQFLFTGHVSVSSNNQNATPMQVDDQASRPSVNRNMSSSSSVPVSVHREFVFGASKNHTSQNDATPIQVDNQAAHW
ncbi:unnamed protein product [Lactuca virosa]|uniref:Uncharacterized protein n=1 Tax=Lactuca virosa TaxID=75947 RepID=A0AAU9LWV0_9ASTR|nr:unnamed protein product [Lactuca virosa]